MRLHVGRGHSKRLVSWWNDGVATEGVKPAPKARRKAGLALTLSVAAQQYFHENNWLLQHLGFTSPRPDIRQGPQSGTICRESAYTLCRYPIGQARLDRPDWTRPIGHARLDRAPGPRSNAWAGPPRNAGLLLPGAPRPRPGALSSRGLIRVSPDCVTQPEDPLQHSCRWQLLKWRLSEPSGRNPRL